MFLIKYFVYNSKEFGSMVFRETIEEANELIKKLSKLKHVTHINEPVEIINK